jgi:putative redox protein
MQTTVKWVEALAFDAVADSGHIARLDTTVEGGGLNSGMSPKRMLLASVCGCTGIDVVEFMQKQNRQKKYLKSLHISTSPTASMQQRKILTK